MRIHIISISTNEKSLSRRAVELLCSQLRDTGVTVTITDVRDLPPVWVNGAEIDEPPEGYGQLAKEIAEADGVVFALPIYNYTMSSPAKAVSEIIGDLLERKPVSFLVAAGSQKSYLAVRDLMISMMFEQETFCFPKTVMVHEDSFLESGAAVQDVQERLVSFGQEFVEFCSCLSKNAGAASSEGKSKLQTPIFLELYVKDVASNIKFFWEVLSCELIRDEGDFAELRLANSTLLLNGDLSQEKGHFFYEKINSSQNGIGTEIGITVPDLMIVYKRAKKFSAYKHLTAMQNQEWGMMDFRLVTPDNYYLRITQEIAT